MGLDRAKAVELLTSYLPETARLAQSQVGFEHICKDYANSGTTCAYPAHWLLWRLGCADTSLVNRYEPDTGFRYVAGKNISAIVGSSAFVSLDNRENRKRFLEGTIGPQAGDTIFITGGDSKEKGHYDEHVYTVIGDPSGSAKDKIEWPVSNFGDSYRGSQTGYRIQARGARRDGDGWQDSKDGRKFAGWLDIGKLTAGDLPKATQWDPLAAHSEEPDAGPPLPAAIIGTWKVTKPYRVCYYMFHKGHRVFRIAEDNLAAIVEGGFWFPQSGRITILWECFLEDTITINGSQGTGSDDFSSYSIEKTLRTLETMNKFSNNRGEPVNPKVTRMRAAGAR